MRTRHQTLTRENQEQIREELRQAYDFDPRDPLFGLSRAALSGPRLDRRTTLRLLAAAGTLSAWHLTPGIGTRRAAAQTGGELSAGWAGSARSAPSIRPKSTRCCSSRSRPTC